jgi:hypothetical protein
MVCLRNISVDTLHKGKTEDDDDNNNNNNFFSLVKLHITFLTTPLSFVWMTEFQTLQNNTPP